MKKKEERDDPEVSRRDYIKSAGVAAVGALAGAAVGAAGIHAALPPTVVEKEVVKTVEVEKPVIVEKEVEVKPWIPERWDMETDVAIVGTGFAGLSAAIEAHDAGAEVILLEKMPAPGGNSNINGGQYGAWTSRIIREKRPDIVALGDSPEIMKNDMLKAGLFMNWPELAEKVAKESADGADWLIDLGVEFPPELIIQAGGHSKPRTHQTKNISGHDIVEVLLKEVEKRGITILLEHKLKGIVREKPLDGRVLGVKVEHEGKTTFIRARKAVVLASGGFSRDMVLRKKYVPYYTEEWLSTNQPGATGECILYAEEIGAATVHMSYIQEYPFADPNTGILDKPGLIPFTAPAYAIYVWKNGKRFYNELGTRKEISDYMIWVPKEKPTWTIFDEDIWPKFTTASVIEEGIQRGRIIKADTIEELATKAGIDPAGLKETIEKYNSYVEKGVDEEFGKPVLPNKIDTPPFYAVPQWPAVHHTMGGLQINVNAQVLDTRDKVIPGLYAAGECTGGVHGAVRLGSCALADCIVFGRTAGKNAAREIV